MKTKFVAACFVMGLLIGCNKKEETAKKIESLAPEATAMVKGKSCYESVKDRDTITLSLAMNANNANGELKYKLDGKDKNEGTFSGTFIGDTLYADYTFNSEGKSSVREVVFLRNGDRLTEGYGDMEEKNSKMCFKNPKKVQFGATSLVLTKKDCK